MTDESVESAAAAVARKVLRHPDGVSWNTMRDNLSKVRRPHMVAAVELAMASGWIQRNAEGSYVPGPRHAETPSYRPGARAARARIDCPGGCGKEVAVLPNGRISVHDSGHRLCPVAGSVWIDGSTGLG